MPKVRTFTLRSTVVWWSSIILWSVLLSDFLPAQDRNPIARQVVIATREVPPFAMKNAEGQWVGISIELLREIKADLEANGEQETELEFREMGLKEMIIAVEREDVDMAAAAITVNYEREKRVDFTHAFHSSGLGIAVGTQYVTTWDGILAAVFSKTFLTIMAALLGALLASGVAVYFFERRRNREHFGGGAIRGISSGLWWAAVTITTVGYGDKVPKTLPGRLLGIVWMFAGLFIIASFTASVTSALTVIQLKSRISGPSDLSRVRVATVKESTSESYLRGRHIIAKKHAAVRDALLALKAKKVDAVVYDASILQYEAHQHFPGEIHVLPMTFERQDYAFALPTDSPLRERINQVLLRKIGSPEWKAVLASFFGEQFEQ